jgi:TfoX/Sxy family transcriptional regulator of competence genes
MATKKSIPASPPPGKVEQYEKLVDAIPGIERKGAAMPYTSVNGNMFSFMDKQGDCGIRLPEKDRDEFLKKYKTKLFETQGTVLKEYVTIPGSLLNKTNELKKWLEISYAYVQSLKPKPTKKAAPAKAKKK